MTIRVCGGPTYLAGAVDKDLKRVWKVRYRVEDDGDPPARFGPAAALRAAGLPRIGDVWVFDDDEDLFAVCTGEASITPEGVPATSYTLEFPFSTEPRGGSCTDEHQAGPLLVPADVQVRWEKWVVEATHDRFGSPLTTSSHEPLTGPQVEFDDSRMVVEISKNVVEADLPLLALLNQRLNDRTLWGFPKRWVKFTVESLAPKQYGECYRYFALKTRFEVRPGGWDRVARDVGTKVLDGEWQRDANNLRVYVVFDPVNQNNPSDFIRYKDPEGHETKGVLDGSGRPWNPDEVTLVYDCDFCKAGGGPTIPPPTPGAPTQWRLLNIHTLDGRSIVLSHVFGCTWEVQDDDGNQWSLEETGGTGTGAVWTLTVNGGTGTGNNASWSFVTAWACTGINTLTSDGLPGTPARWTFDAVVAPNTAERTTDCSACGVGAAPKTLGQSITGAPSVWRAQELSTASGEPVRLTHTSGCTWSMTDGMDNWELEPATEDPSGNEVWILHLNGGEVTYSVSEWAWNCRGPNVMTVLDPPPAADPPWPEVVTLVAGNRPGVRPVQYYHEADLAGLLNLPPTV